MAGVLISQTDGLGNFTPWIPDVPPYTDWFNSGPFPPGGGGGGGSGTNQVYFGSFANPNGNVTPGNTQLGAVYYQDNASPISFWQWSVNSQLWEPIVS